MLHSPENASSRELVEPPRQTEGAKVSETAETPEPTGSAEWSTRAKTLEQQAESLHNQLSREFKGKKWDKEHPMYQEWRATMRQVQQAHEIVARESELEKVQDTLSRLAEDEHGIGPVLASGGSTRAERGTALDASVNLERTREEALTHAEILTDQRDTLLVGFQRAEIIKIVEQAKQGKTTLVKEGEPQLLDELRDLLTLAEKAQRELLKAEGERGRWFANTLKRVFGGLKSVREAAGAKDRYATAKRAYEDAQTRYDEAMQRAESLGLFSGRTKGAMRERMAGQMGRLEPVRDIRRGAGTMSIT